MLTGRCGNGAKLDAAPSERYHGGAQNDILLGGSGVNHFDGDAGGDDTLLGRGGDDVYWLGRGTGHDTVSEAYGNTGAGDTGDEIRVKSGILPSSVDLLRSKDGSDLHVRLVDANGVVTDSLKVLGYYTSSKAKVESVVFADGTVWGAKKLDAAPSDRYRGSAQNDILQGGSGVNHFDGDAGGSDTLYGKSGDDVYWLGRGTGHDVVDEVSGNTGTGDTGDEIRVKAGIAPSSVDLLRSKDGSDLSIRALGTNGVVTDSLKVLGYYTSSKAKVERVVFADGTVWGAKELDAAPSERYRGSAQNDSLYGNNGVNHFDGDAGGNDTLYGKSGDDVYWLGRGTGHDVVDEALWNTGTGDTGDEIRVKAGVLPKSVELLRSKDGADLSVRLLDANGVVTDSLRVRFYYLSSKAKVERVVFADETVWDGAKLDAAPSERYRGSAQDDILQGGSGVNHFDGDAGGSDTLRGGSGDDAYWLGRGTGHDVVDEVSGNTGTGDTGDEIRVKAGIAPFSVELLRSKNGSDLHVRLVDANGVVTDSLKVLGYYTSSKAKVERLVFADGTVWDGAKLDAAPPSVRIRGSAQDDILLGDSGVNHLDGDAGGSDTLRGRGGNDVYWLGRGTGHDVVDESHQNTVIGDTGDEIRVKAGIAPFSVELLRSKNGSDLYVRLVDANGVVTDSLRVKGYYTSASAKVERVVFADGTVWGSAKLDAAAPSERSRGTAQDDILLGDSGVNHFDGDAGGSDTLRGRGGNDVYWLGRGTGHDVVDESHQNTVTGDTGDEIRVKAGIAPSSVELLRSKDRADLYVRVLDANGVVTDSLRVKGYYTSASAKVERVVFADGTVWGSAKLDVAPYERYRGGARNDVLHGSSGVDHFDGDAGGNDVLRGRGGNDVYWLGRGTGHDTIDEAYGNTGNGDTGDEIRVKAGIAPSSVRMERTREHLYVRVFGADGVATDSLKVDRYYTSARARRVERVVFADGTVWGAKEMGALRLRGTSYSYYLSGSSERSDIFDEDVGNRYLGRFHGSNRLRGQGGDDVYWLGRGTGHDIIDEAYGNTGNGDTGDEIRVKASIAPSSVRLERAAWGGGLHVRLFGADGVVTDSLTVKDYYTSARARVERVVFADGTVWGAKEMGAVRLRGTSSSSYLYGSSGRSDIFDADVNSFDTLRGQSGDDVYWLGLGTGHDTIDEAYGNTGNGDTGDEIRVKAGIAPSSVRLERDREHLYVLLFGADGVATDSLKVEDYYTSARARVERVVFADETVWGAKEMGAVRRRGTSWNNELLGYSGRSDIFDADVGGKDTLRGLSGDDVYWLGRGTGHDVVDEGYQNTDTGDTGDEIRLKSGIGVADVRVRRIGEDLHVEVLDAFGTATDSLRVKSYYALAKAKVERVVFADETVWGASEIEAMRGRVMSHPVRSSSEIRGTSRDEYLYGHSGRSDIFDADVGGGDRLHGRSGNDVYWLGRGTGHDTIDEAHGNTGNGDTGDEIRLKAGIAPSSVRLERDREHLYVRVFGADGVATDSLKVEDYYTSARARVERVVFADGTVWGAKEMGAVRLRGDRWGNRLLGYSGRSDIFDADVSGFHTLRGQSGDDVYWLGLGTGHDTIDEAYGNTGNGDTGDEIRLKAGIAPSSVRLERDREHLYVRLFGADGVATDSLKVWNHYTSARARVERVVFADGTVWGAKEMDALRIRGTSGNDYDLQGFSGRSDTFDADVGGNDTLRGRSGDDVYWLGRGTGHDLVDEAYGNTGNGDTGDEIRLKAGIAPSSVRLERNGDNLYVRVFDKDWVVTDSLTVKDYYTSARARVERMVFADGTVWNALKMDALRIRGSWRDEGLYGSSGRSDTFDADAGGTDVLYGRSGDDVYWLGRGTDHDFISEVWMNSGNGDSGDEIRVKASIAPSSVELLRSKDGASLYVRVLGTNGLVTDSLSVQGYYTSLKAKVESVVFADGTVWGGAKLDAAMYERYRGSAQNNSLYGSNLVNHFDADAGGNDTLRGRGGDDVYWLGHGTGHDVVDEGYQNTGNGDSGDKIRVKSGIGVADVRLRRVGDDLYVDALGSSGTATDSLKVKGHYASDKSRVESIHAAGKVLLARQYLSLMHEMALFDAGNSQFSDMNSLLGRFWQDESTLATPSSSG